MTTGFGTAPFGTCRFGIGTLLSEVIAALEATLAEIRTVLDGANVRLDEVAAEVEAVKAEAESQ